MLNNHYSNILNEQEMEYFDFINHFDWFDEQGVNHIAEPLNLLVNPDCLTMTVREQKAVSLHQKM